MFIETAYAAADAVQTSSVDWSLLAPMMINACITIGGLAYMFGGVSHRIKVVEVDIEKVSQDFRALRDSNSATNDRIQNIAITLSKMEARFDMFLTAASERSNCPLLKASIPKEHVG